MDTGSIGSGIVEISRKARFADISVEEWTARLSRLVATQPEVIDSADILDVRPVATAAGGSNGTYLFDARYLTSQGMVERSLVLRFLPVEGLFHRHDVREQFNLQRALEQTDVPVATQIWLDAEGRHLGRPGYVMEKVPGVGPPMAWMTSGVIAEASPAERHEMGAHYARTLARIHAVDWRGLGLGWLSNRAEGTRPVEREVNWYWDALEWRNDDEARLQLAPIRDWLIANEPSDLDVVLCHGDSNLGNYLFEGTRVCAVLDWEMAFLGTPECDLAFVTVGDSVLQGDVPYPDGFPTHEATRAIYEKISGRTLRDWDYFLLFAAFRIAVINFLAMAHFPADVLPLYLPTLERGPKLCRDKARAMGISVGMSLA